MKSVLTALFCAAALTCGGCESSFHASFDGNQFANSLAGDAFKALDSDHSGAVTRDEFLKDPVEASMHSLFNKIDSNNDDKISPSEFHEFDRN